MTGMISGMDTESIIQSLVSVKSQKVTSLKNDQKKLEWKQTAWQDLNKKIYSLYTNTLSNLRLSGSYAKKTTKCSDTTKATVVASDGAVNGTQTLKVKKVAKSGYLTGARLPEHVTTDDEGNKVKGFKSTDKLSSISTGLAGSKISLTVGEGTDDEKITSIELTNDMTIGDLVGKFKEAGVNASFDEINQRFFISATGTGTEKDFKLSGNVNALAALGLNAGAVTGSKLTTTDGKTVNNANFSLLEIGATDKAVDSSNAGSVIKFKVAIGNDAPTEITVSTQKSVTTSSGTSYQEATIDDVLNAINDKKMGVTATFDSTNQRIILTASEGYEASIIAEDSDSQKALAALGLSEDKMVDQPVKIDGQNAEIELNGATFTSDTNAFSVNGLTITASAVTAEGEELSITTDTDYDGIYDMIKDFVDEYNDIINEMYKLYNADSTRKYSMLTDEQKESMTDEEVEKWEDTIKGSLLRKDNDLYKIMNTMRESINKGYTAALDENGKPIKDDPLYGKTWYIFDFGIGTLNYFEAEEGERYALHIDGNSDDDKTNTKEYKLKKAIATDPEGTIAFFSALCKDMYNAIGDTMKRTDYRSSYKVYDDKRLQTEYDDYSTKIKKAQKELEDYEDRWYDKFASMETALSKLQNTQNSISSMLGM